MAHTQYRVLGKRVPSVTTVLSRFKEAGPLMWWSHNVAFEVLEESVELLNRYENNNTIHHDEPNINLETDVQSFLSSKPLDRANFRKQSQTAAEAGTVAHNLVDQWIHASPTEQINLGNLKPPDIQAITRCTKDQSWQVHSSFQAFIKWAHSNKFVLVETEVQLVSHEYRYGGTIDCVGHLHDDYGSFVLCDWKTSKALYLDYVLQIAAYGQLWNENWEPWISSYHLIRFDKLTADFHHVSFTDMDDALEMFLLLREAYELSKRIEKRIK